ncbi:MAG: tyrosine-type recombinase/integrase [Candidatus Pacebacteria bacterium]|nr:tyrosine-type recombinase/integrase [Candidatus Paceibacterota bacterium]
MNTLAEQKRQFLEHLRGERGRSEKTIENYNRYLERFLKFVKVKKVNDLTEEQGREFCLYLDRQPGTKVGGRVEPMKSRTKNYYLIALRAFLKFLRKRGIESLSPERIKLAKVTESSIDLITLAELKRLVSAPDTKTLEGKRDKAILELLFSTGLRISELCVLVIDDIDLSRDEFSIRGKGDNVRVVFLSVSTRVTLRDYLKHRKDTDGALFVRYGRKMNDGGDLRISPRAVQRLIKHYAAKAGITRKVTPQTLRHIYATKVLSSGVDLHRAQMLLGHEHISTTQAYAQSMDKQRRDDGEKV